VKEAVQEFEFVISRVMLGASERVDPRLLVGQVGGIEAEAEGATGATGKKVTDQGTPARGGPHLRVGEPATWATFGARSGGSRACNGWHHACSRVRRDDMGNSFHANGWYRSGGKSLAMSSLFSSRTKLSRREGAGGGVHYPSPCSSDASASRPSIIGRRVRKP